MRHTRAVPLRPAQPSAPICSSAHRFSAALAAVVAAIVGFVAFVPALRNEFVYDDAFIIVHNPTVTEPGKWYRFWREPWWPRVFSHDPLYRPLTLWTYRANVVLQKPLDSWRGSGRPRSMNTFGEAGIPPDPFGFHLVNLLIHSLTCACVALLALRITDRAAAAWIAGLLFAAHPIHTEAVVTGYGRAELLAGFFCTWLLARYAIQPERRPHTFRFHAFNALLYLAAIMSKEHALFLWPALLAIDCWPRGRGSAPRKTWRERLNRTLGPAHAGFALACALFFTLRYSVFLWRMRASPADLRHWEAPLAHATLTEHLLTPLRLLWLATELIFWPLRLCPIWAKSALDLANHFSPDVLAGLGVACFFLALGAVLWLYRKPVGALALGSLALLALPIQAIPLASWFFAERWLYLPSILLAVLAGAALARGGVLAVLLSVALTLVLLPASWSYCAAFKDNLTMYREVIQRQPDNMQGYRCLTPAYLAKGDFTGAAQTGAEFIARFGDVPEAYQYLAPAYLALGDGERALWAVNKYEKLTQHLPGPGLGELRRRAIELIESKQRRAWSAGQPESSPASQP